LLATLFQVLWQRKGYALFGARGSSRGANIKLNGKSGGSASGPPFLLVCSGFNGAAPPPDIAFILRFSPA
jgi:hypothetical protein